MASGGRHLAFAATPSLAIVRPANLVGRRRGGEADVVSIGTGSCEPRALSCGSSEILAFLLTFKVVLGVVDGAGISRAAVPASGVFGASGPGVFGASGPVTMEKLLGDPGAAVPPCSPIAPSWRRRRRRVLTDESASDLYSWSCL